MKKNLTKLLTLLLAAAMLLTLAACGKEKSTGVTGKYRCIAISSDGTNFTAPENAEAYVELKKGGKGEINDVLTYALTWKLDGEAFSGTYQIFSIDVPVTGTLKDGVLEISDEGTVTRYLKEGLETPDWAKDLAAAPKEEGRLAGHYTLFAMDIDGEYYDYDALVEMEMGEMDDSYLQIDYDKEDGYTGELCFDGEDPDSFVLDESLGTLLFSDGTETAYYESEEGVIGVTFEELNSTISYYALDPAGHADTDDPLLAGQNEDAAGSETGASSAGYGKSNAAATGKVSLDTLKTGWETIRNSDNKYELLYEDVRDLMGCDGEPYQIDGVKNAYCWQNGSAILTVTFKVLEDGNEELNAIAITGLD